MKHYKINDNINAFPAFFTGSVFIFLLMIFISGIWNVNRFDHSYKKQQCLVLRNKCCNSSYCRYK